MPHTQEVFSNQGNSCRSEQKLIQLITLDSFGGKQQPIVWGHLPFFYWGGALCFIKNMLWKFVPTSTDLQISSSTINPRIYSLIFHLRMNLKYQQKESLSRDRQVDEEKKKKRKGWSWVRLKKQNQRTEMGERDGRGRLMAFFPLDDLKTQLLLSLSITLRWILLFPLYRWGDTYS